MATLLMVKMMLAMVTIVMMMMIEMKIERTNRSRLSGMKANLAILTLLLSVVGPVLILNRTLARSG